ncbi:MAG: tRNA (5-methylaminomethyl-2-thiouridine)(34)-methyltransferase MnmD [Polaribacter sp.]
MKREIIITSDGSTTIHLPDWNEQYHSKHGAIQEAYHVFIKAGLEKVLSSTKSNQNTIPQKNKTIQTNISILEIGFGTGLNAIITFLETKKVATKIDYVGVEAYPISEEEVERLNYIARLKAKKHQKDFKKMHTLSWEEKHMISENFSLTKKKQFFQEIKEKNTFDLIYFDAFGAKNQPELWTEVIFSNMFTALKKNGILVTYSAKGSVRRAMESVGFVVERLEGPLGKREMLRAVRK